MTNPASDQLLNQLPSTPDYAHPPKLGENVFYLQTDGKKPQVLAFYPAVVTAVVSKWVAHLIVFTEKGAVSMLNVGGSEPPSIGCWSRTHD